jgi:hypothetical protein
MSINERGEFIRDHDAPGNIGSTGAYESMSFDEIESDPAAGPVLQRVALNYLKTYNKEYFDREFTGELDKDGYLIRKDGQNANTKPSQNIGGGQFMTDVVNMTRIELKKQSK